MNPARKIVELKEEIRRIRDGIGYCESNNVRVPQSVKDNLLKMQNKLSVLEIQASQR